MGRRQREIQREKKSKQTTSGMKTTKKYKNI